jgi:hypothetical protein
MKPKNITQSLAGILVALFALAPLAQAQDAAANYPNRPIRVVVAFAAGGERYSRLRRRCRRAWASRSS